MLLLHEMPPKGHCHGSSYIWKNGLDIKWPPMRSACPNQTKAPSKKNQVRRLRLYTAKIKLQLEIPIPNFSTILGLKDIIILANC